MEVTEPLREKLLTNVAYCSNVNLSKFFLDEMTSEISNVYSSTDNLILFGDYNINILKETGKQLLNNFIADIGLQYVNTKKATWTNGEKFSSNNHCYISKNQIFKTYIIESILENDPFAIVYQSSLKLEWKQQNTEYLMRDKKRYTRSKFNRDIALQDWSLMYKIIGANENVHKVIEIFQNVLNSQAPLKNTEAKTKKSTKNGYQKNCVVSLMKSIVYSMNGKKDPNQELFNIYKVLRNNVNRKLRKASDDYTKQFFENLLHSEEQWKFIKNKINSIKQTEKIAKLKEGHNVISDEKSIANCSNNLFCPSWTLQGRNHCS